MVTLMSRCPAMICDVWWESVEDGVGDEESSKVVWGEAQRLSGRRFVESAVGDGVVEHRADRRG